MDKEIYESEENYATDTEELDFMPDNSVEASEEAESGQAPDLDLESDSDDFYTPDDFPAEEFSFLPDGEDISYFLTEDETVVEPTQVDIFGDEPSMQHSAESEPSEDNVEELYESLPSELTAQEPLPVKKSEARVRRVDTLFDFLELFVFTLAAVLLVTTFLFRHSVVEGDSMIDTLHDKETVIISNLFYTPQNKDIVVVDDHSTILKKPIVKRVIAVGGQTVRITKTEVFVDGELLNEEYVFIDDANYTYDIIPSSVLLENAEKLNLKYVRGSYYEITVPEGELFVMGDHRNKSTDSRVIGTVDEDAVLGRVVLRILPFAKFGTVD